MNDKEIGEILAKEGREITILGRIVWVSVTLALAMLLYDVLNF